MWSILSSIQIVKYVTKMIKQMFSIYAVIVNHALIAATYFVSIFPYIQFKLNIINCVSIQYNVFNPCLHIGTVSVIIKLGYRSSIYLANNNWHCCAKIYILSPRQGTFTYIHWSYMQTHYYMTSSVVSCGRI